MINTLRKKIQDQSEYFRHWYVKYDISYFMIYRDTLLDKNMIIVSLCLLISMAFVSTMQNKIYLKYLDRSIDCQIDSY